MCETFSVVHDEQKFYVSLGYEPGSAPKEVFISGRGRAGSMLDHLLYDAGVLASILLQHGVTTSEVLESLSRLEDGQMASVVGRAFQELTNERTSSTP